MKPGKTLLGVGAAIILLWFLWPSGDPQGDEVFVPERCDVKDASGLLEKVTQRGASCLTEAVWGVLGKDGSYKSVLLAVNQGEFTESVEPASLGAESYGVTVYTADPSTAYRLVVLNADGDQTYDSTFQAGDVSVVRVDYIDFPGADTLQVYQGGSKVFEVQYP